MNIREKINELGLPEGNFIVVGSGILNALGIRESGDIDLVVSDDVYDKYQSEGWEFDSWADQTVLKHDVFDLGKSWYGKKVNELLKDAQYVEDIPYLSLKNVYEWKKTLGREKDIRDLMLIEQYEKND